MFDWDEANIRHIAEHGVLPSEAEEVILRSPLDLDTRYAMVKYGFARRERL
jgi:hypothetical protein